MALEGLNGDILKMDVFRQGNPDSGLDDCRIGSKPKTASDGCPLH
jgi:hypothetical protein